MAHSLGPILSLEVVAEEHRIEVLVCLDCQLSHFTVDHVTVVYLVVRSLNKSEADVDLVLVETSVLFY